ncbi:MAG: diguanylate cyclase [Xanthomonadales bacterium]|nr:diguanylate cyclase [Xanthomonadales bacterium]
MARLGLRRRISILFAVVLALLAALAWTMWSAIDQAQVDARDVAHAWRVREAVARLENELRSAVASQRGYLLTGDAALLAGHHRAVPVVDALAEELQLLLATQVAEAARARRLVELVRMRLTQLDEVLTLYHDQGLPAATALLAGSERMALEAELAQVAAALLAGEAATLAGRQRRSEASQRSSRLVATGAVALGVLLLTLSFTLVFREQQARWRAEGELRRNARQLQESLAEMDLRAQELGTLAALGESLQACRSRDEALAAATRAAAGLLPEAAGQVLVPGGEGLSEAWRWGEPAVASLATFPEGECWALRSGQAVQVEHPQAARVCGHLHAEDLGAGASLCLPLVAHGQPQGLLQLSRWRPFDDRERQLAASLSEQLSMAMANLRLQEDLRAEAIRDVLTGLHNRRWLAEAMPRELARARRGQRPLAVMMIDLDHFKRYNDSHGHAGGDALLAAFGRLLTSQVRTEDIACRHGGEEFVVVLPGADAGQALARADDLRSALAGLRPIEGGRVLPTTTASVGIAVADPAGDTTPAALLAHADRALYRAKTEGRDRSVVAADG